jgi:D-specific alpha-keto acid dehydrogenase
MGITFYGCGQEEAALFREMAPGFGAVPTITEAAVSEGNIGLALGNRCISIGHKTRVTNAVLLALSEAGVMPGRPRVGTKHTERSAGHAGCPLWD